MKTRPTARKAPKRDIVTKARVDKIIRLRGKYRSQIPLTRHEKKLCNNFGVVNMAACGLVDTTCAPQLMKLIETYNSQTSAFLRLPGEIRNHVYEDLFNDTITIYSINRNCEEFEEEDNLPFRIRNRLTPLWLVSRQIYQETFLMLCAAPIFRVEEVHALEEFTSHVKTAYIKAIRVLEFTEDTLWATKNLTIKKFAGLQKLIVPFTPDTTKELVVARLEKSFPNKQILVVEPGSVMKEQAGNVIEVVGGADGGVEATYGN